MLRRATRRPWRRVSHREFGRTIYQGVTTGMTKDVEGDGHGYIFQCGLRHTRSRDAALIVAAVNDYEALLDIAEAAAACVVVTEDENGKRWASANPARIPALEKALREYAKSQSESSS